ncbi:MAG: AraC family transcriptional regulator [Polyangiales bacterium]
MTISILLVRALVGAVERSGGCRDQLLAAATIDPNALDDVHARVSRKQFHRVKLAALELTGDPALGLHIGEHEIRGELDVIGHLADAADTLRQSLEAVVRYSRLFDEGPDWGLRESGDSAVLRFPFRAGSACPGIRLSVELGNSIFLGLIRRFVEPDAVPRQALFGYAPPSYRGEYARVFAGAERFDQPYSGLEFERGWLDCRQLYRNAELYEALCAQAERALARLDRDAPVTSRVKAHLASYPPAGMPSMVETARHLGISARSLRRRLATEGVVYSDLIEATLANTAKRLLESPQASIHETSYAMGFSVPTAFHRAFKRWTGKTPREYMRTY